MTEDRFFSYHLITLKIIILVGYNDKYCVRMLKRGRWLDSIDGLHYNCLLYLIHYRIFLIKEIKYIEKYLKLIYDQSN